jgi:glutamate synthase (NADPH/NADH) small chain
MPELSPDERIRNFSEVAHGYTPGMASAEAMRCLLCRGAKAKCVRGCPMGINIPKFIAEAAAGKFTQAYQTIRKQNPLPGVCGRICPEESQCQAQCIAAIKGEAVSVAHLERFVGDWQRSHAGSPTGKPIPPDAPRVAVIGSGPAALTCAADLARLGCDVTVYEEFGHAGGVLMYGIPEFRLPKVVVEQEVEGIRCMGVKFCFHEAINGIEALRELLDKSGFQAAYVSSCAELPAACRIPGGNLKGTYSAQEFLARIRQTPGGESALEQDVPLPSSRVVVAGGGNTAIDCARAAVRMGASEVTVAYRRSLQEMPARACEVEHARQEGIQFLPLSTPVRLIGDEDNKLRRVECVETELGAPDPSGRACPILKSGSEFQLSADTWVMAMGQGPNPVWASTIRGLESGARGGFEEKADAHRTCIPGVFAGGEMIGGGAITLAMRAGRTAARAIHRYLSSRTVLSDGSAQNIGLRRRTVII